MLVLFMLRLPWNQLVETVPLLVLRGLVYRERFVRFPVPRLNSRLMTWSGWSAETESCHLPDPAPNRPESPLAPCSS